MRIWFDADNAPHVLVMKPLASRLEALGHEVFFTARPRAGTVELLSMHGMTCTVVGGGAVRGAAGKALGVLARALGLLRAVRGRRPDLSFGHGSRSLPIASRLAGVPTVTMYDYEWVSPSIFNRFCSAILLPEVIDDARCSEAGIRTDLVRRFPGFKEQLYLRGRSPDPSIPERLGLDPGRRSVLVRPPARTAHYHRPEAEEIYETLLSSLCSRDLQVVLIPRDGGDVPEAGPPNLVIPKAPVDGPGLILSMDCVFGGGGTMTREAAVLGVPSVSYFRGRTGRVDEHLAALGRLVFLTGREQAAAFDPSGLPRNGALESADLPAVVAGMLVSILRPATAG